MNILAYLLRIMAEDDRRRSRNSCIEMVEVKGIWVAKGSQDERDRLKLSA